MKGPTAISRHSVAPSADAGGRHVAWRGRFRRAGLRGFAWLPRARAGCTGCRPSSSAGWSPSGSPSCSSSSPAPGIRSVRRRTARPRPCAWLSRAPPCPCAWLSRARARRAASPTVNAAVNALVIVSEYFPLALRREPIRAAPVPRLARRATLSATPSHSTPPPTAQHRHRARRRVPRLQVPREHPALRRLLPPPIHEQVKAAVSSGPPRPWRTRAMRHTSPTAAVGARRRSWPLAIAGGASRCRRYMPARASEVARDATDYCVPALYPRCTQHRQSRQ